jgi:hypothetical protein
MNARTHIALALLLAILPTSAAARSHPGTRGDFDNGTAEGGPDEARIYVGMWTAHLRDLRRGFDNNWLVGVVWRGYYAGTFVNSYRRRAFTAGIQGAIVRGENGAIVPGVGYRLGLVTGYDGRFSAIATKTPVLPVAQLLGDVQVGPTGVELGWAGLVASLGPKFRF